jgi:hypothetical protein
MSVLFVGTLGLYSCSGGEEAKSENTSPWVCFEDEGHGKVCVLDSPGFAEPKDLVPPCYFIKGSGGPVAVTKQGPSTKYLIVYCN